MHQLCFSLVNLKQHGKDIDRYIHEFRKISVTLRTAEEPVEQNEARHWFLLDFSQMCSCRSIQKIFKP